MKTLDIPKKSGGTRKIYIQGPKEKHNYRYKGYQLAEFYEKHGTNSAHGFRTGKSPVSNASCHINKQFSLTIDLKDFFDTITPKHLISAGVKTGLAHGVCYEGSIKQGLSSSPSAANCAAIPLDNLIIQTINNSDDKDIIYTRYADDLTFSSNSLQSLLYLRSKVSELVKTCGFEVNNKKTRIQSSKFGRRIITGIAVDDKINPRKKQKRFLRAAAHNMKKLKSLLSFLVFTNQLSSFALILEANRKNISKFVGLREWCKLKEPTENLNGKLFQTAVKIRTMQAFK